MSTAIPPRNLLLVEGVDDRHVVSHISGQSSGSLDFQIRDKNGYANLKRAIRPEAKVSGRMALGIVVDADEDPQGRWKAIRDQFSSIGITVPLRMDPDGTIIDHEPRVGIWLMPNNRDPGELEDFVKMLIPDTDPVWPMAQRYIVGIPANARKFTPKKVSRAQIHAWLATRKEPRKMGVAIGAGDLSIEAPFASRLTGWLERLFSCD